MFLEGGIQNILPMGYRSSEICNKTQNVAKFILAYDMSARYYRAKWE